LVNESELPPCAGGFVGVAVELASTAVGDGDALEVAAGIP